ncbi:MAG: hypothetical protein D6744_04275, partial [Planctomycetota bacterium]
MGKRKSVDSQRRGLSVSYHRIAATLLLAVVVAPLTGCGTGTGAGRDGAERAGKVNVVMFLIDTLRADRVGCYGYDKPTSPAMDALAAEGVLFTRAQAPAPWTCPSIPSIFTSTFLCEHGITTELKRLSPKIKTLAERFKQIDYHTASYFINTFAGPTTGMDRGFDIAVLQPHGRFFVDGRVTDEWAQQRPADKPFFLYVHNIEPHNPFRAPRVLVPLFGNVDPAVQNLIGQLVAGRYRPNLRPDWDVRRGGMVRPLGTTDREAILAAAVAELDKHLAAHSVLYDAVVREADQRLASVIASLKRNNLWDDTLFIVLADHGEELSEHGDYLHSQSVYEELSAVPLIIRFPGNEYAGRVVEDVVTLVDVLPTIFDYLGRPDLSDGARGRSLMPLVRGERRPPGEFVVTTVRENIIKYRKRWDELRGNINIAVYTRDGRWKGIWNVERDTFEIYDHENDPTDLVNVCDEHPELRDAMYQFVREWYASCGGEAISQESVSDESLRVLEALGYAGGEIDDDDAE